MRAFLPLIFAFATTQAASAIESDLPISCDRCAGWNGAVEPFKIFGNTYYVGVNGISAILLASKQGLILLDGGLPQSAALIDANIRRLGFRTEDIRLIANSHAHFDHAGGIAALQRASGATVVAGAAGIPVLERGEVGTDDPQYVADHAANRFPAVKKPQAAKDGGTLRVGELAITAHAIPGHAPGSTAWTWRSCENERCLDIVYADSLNAVAASGYRFIDHAEAVDVFRSSIARVAQLPCEILLTPHPDIADLLEKQKKARLPENRGNNPFIAAQACKNYAEQSAKRLEAILAEESARAD